MIISMTLNAGEKDFLRSVITAIIVVLLFNLFNYIKKRRKKKED